MTRPTTVSSLFHPEPFSWALRGDPYLWKSMEAEFTSTPLPGSVAELTNMIENMFLRLTGKPMSGEDMIWCEQYAHGGMSSGGISVFWWRTYVLPMMSERFLAITEACMERIDAPTGLQIPGSTEKLARAGNASAKSETYEFHQLCSVCDKGTSTIQLSSESGNWRLTYAGCVAGNGSGDAIKLRRARTIIRGFSKPYTVKGIRAAGFYDDGGFCLECEQFYCPTHWNVSTTGGGRCPNGHFKSLDPQWSPDW